MERTRILFVDTGAFIARYRPSDDNHAKALTAWKEIETHQIRCVTSHYVVAEFARYLSLSRGNTFAAQRLRALYGSDLIRVVNAERDIEFAAIDLLEKYADQVVGFVDCVSFALMKQNRIETAFGFDRHFQIAGLKLWPVRK